METPEQRLIRDLDMRPVRDAHGLIWFEPIPPDDRPPSILDARFYPGGPSVRELVDDLGRGTATC